MKLAEVECQLKEARTSTRTRSLLDEKRRELDKLKTSTRTREEFSKVRHELEEEKAKRISSKTMAEYERQQALLRKLKDERSGLADIDVAFLLDCTGSMSSYINAAKDHINEIVNEIVSR